MIPDLLSYPPITNFSELAEADGKVIYAIDHYEEQGIALLIVRETDNDQVRVVFGDFDAKPIDMSIITPGNTKCVALLSEYGSKLISLMKLINVKQALYYFSETDGQLSLVDVRIGLDKFLSPGMLRDLFGNIVPTQKIIKIAALDEKEKLELQAKPGTIIKCSAFKTIVRGSDLLPCYGKINEVNPII